MWLAGIFPVDEMTFHRTGPRHILRSTSPKTSLTNLVYSLLLQPNKRQGRVGHTASKVAED